MSNTNTIRTMDDERYEYCPLDTSVGHALLPPEHELVMNKVSGKVTLVDWERRRFVSDSSFTDEELPLILTLLNDWPSYVPYEKMLILTSDETPEQIAQRVEEAHTTNTLATILTPVRSLLTACNEHMHLFSIDIAAFYEQEEGALALSVDAGEEQHLQERGEQVQRAS